MTLCAPREWPALLGLSWLAPAWLALYATPRKPSSLLVMTMGLVPVNSHVLRACAPGRHVR